MKPGTKLKGATKDAKVYVRRSTTVHFECGLAWYVLLSTTIRVITVVKMLWTHEAQPSESGTTNFLPQYQR